MTGSVDPEGDGTSEANEQIRATKDESILAHPLPPPKRTRRRETPPSDRILMKNRIK